MSTPLNLERLSCLIGPHIAKNDSALWFEGMAMAIKLGLISVQDLRINMRVMKDTDELHVEFDAFCCDGPAVHEDTSEASGSYCTLTKSCWLAKGHDGPCN